MPRTCRGFGNEDNDLKSTAGALKSLSRESRSEGAPIENEVTLAM